MHKSPKHFYNGDTIMIHDKKIDETGTQTCSE